MKKTDNKGFSLVELIIVIAIMAVLMAVLAPQFLKYVESSRVQKDESAAEEYRHATEIAMSNETIYKSVGLSDTTTKATVTIPDNGAIAGNTDLIKELKNVCGDTVDFTSSTHAGQTYTITITYDKTEKTIKVTGEFAAPAAP
ncbi:MAG: type II secretion system protein [bacterium]|nr:type II secretion system protein [bacterium]